MVRTHSTYLIVATAFLAVLLVRITPEKHVSAQQTPPSAPVTVVNTNANPLPVRAPSPLPISGNVSLSGTSSVAVTNLPLPVQQSGAWNVGVAGNVNASQQGAWNVGIAGIPIVKIDPAGNLVRVASSGTTLIHDSGIKTLAGPIFDSIPLLDIRPYSKIRVSITPVSGRTGFAIAADSGTSGVDHRTGVRLDASGVGQGSEHTDGFTKVYELAGASLSIVFQDFDGGEQVRVMVFGN